MHYGLMVLGIVAVILSGAAYWQYERANAAEQDLVAAETEIIRLSAIIQEQYDTINRIQNDMLAQRGELEDLREETNEVIVERDEAKRRLDTHRQGIKDRALRDPVGLGDAATRATHRIMQSIERATGALEGDNRAGGTDPIPAAATDEGGDAEADDSGVDPGVDEEAE